MQRRPGPGTTLQRDIDGERGGLDPFKPGQRQACRGCGAPLTEEVADLGLVPVSVDPVRITGGVRAVACAPLRAFVCDDCRLVQIGTGGAMARDPAPRPADG